MSRTGGPFAAEAASAFRYLVEDMLCQENLDEVCAETWPGGDEAWLEGIDSPEAHAHSRNVYLGVLTSLEGLIQRHLTGEWPI